MNTSDNPNPVISKEVEVVQYDAEVDDEDTDEPINEVEIYEHLSGITDPEHEELSLAQLDIVGTDRIRVDAQKHRVAVQFTPTVPHCSVATLIGLSIRTKLIRALPSQYKIDVRVTPGSHVSEGAVNKQLNDKERVAAATENSRLITTVNRSLERSYS
mmetsp:Transcript_44602/g.115960  ORF Transcript_44602/g.115960 Transcript_44602/m.115960 type:complete len:158 (-) Transcript_44602:517-990(-)